MTNKAAISKVIDRINTTLNLYVSKAEDWFIDFDKSEEHVVEYLRGREFVLGEVNSKTYAQLNGYLQAVLSVLVYRDGKL